MDDELVRAGDRMHSETSRLVEWAKSRRVEMPYEVRMAFIGLKAAIDEWTEIRHRAYDRPTLHAELADAIRAGVPRFLPRLCCWGLRV
jgi:hypothetical protein